MYIKFIYSEKATKFWEIFPLLLTAVHTIKSKGKISQNFVAFSEYMNFTTTEKQRAYCPNTVSSPGFTNNQVDINLRLSLWRWTLLLPFVCFCFFPLVALKFSGMVTLQVIKWADYANHKCFVSLKKILWLRFLLGDRTESWIYFQGRCNKQAWQAHGITMIYGIPVW